MNKYEVRYDHILLNAQLWLMYASDKMFSALINSVAGKSLLSMTQQTVAITLRVIMIHAERL